MDISIERRIELLRYWCNTVLMANLVNKHDIWFEDVYPYKTGEGPIYPQDKRTGTPVISRPLIGQTGWECYKPENIKGIQIHYLQILRNRYQPWETFETFISKNSHK